MEWLVWGKGGKGWKGEWISGGGRLWIVGVVLMLVGQVARSLAMIHAGTNFSHLVAYRREEGHVLVKSGIYWLVFFITLLPVSSYFLFC